MGYRIKWRFLVKLTIVLLVAGAAIYFVHRWQVKSQVGAFLRHADQARAAAEQAAKDGNPKAAGEEREREQTFLQRYILARPDDIDIRERLARLMCENAKTGRQKLNAYFALEEVLRKDQDREDLRRFTIKYAIKPPLGLYKEARDQLTKDGKLKEQYWVDGEMCGLFARCYAVERNYEEAVKQYRHATRFPLPAIAKDNEKPNYDKPVEPSTIKLESYIELAHVQRLSNKVEDANQTMSFMLRENKSNFRAQLAAFDYLRQYGLRELPEDLKLSTPAFSQEQLVADALGIASQDLDVLIAASDLARGQSRQWGRTRHYLMPAAAKERVLYARELLQTAVEKHPSAENSYLAMASLEFEERQVADAIQVIRKGLDQQLLKDSVKLWLGLMEYQFQAGDTAGANETLNKLQALGLQPGVEEFESARISMLKEDWKNAAIALQQAIPQLHDKSELIRKAHLFLGRCYAELGEHEKRLDAYTRAVPPEVGTQAWGASMIGIAESETALGRLDDALKSYRKMTDWFPAMWVPVARLELLRALGTPDEKGRWVEVDKALAAADAAAERDNGRYIPDDTDLRIIHAGVKHYKGMSKEARDDLEKLLEKKPKSSAVRIELAMQALREKNPKPAEALAILESAEKDLGDSPEIRIARGRVWAATNQDDPAAMKPDELAAKLTTLAAAPPTYSAADKRRLLRGLAEVASGAGIEETAGKLWSDLAVARPFDLSIQLIRFDQAGRAGNLDAMASIAARIRELEGPDGHSARLTRGLYLLQKAQKENKREDREAREDRDAALELFNEIERKQGAATPARVLFAQAIIHDLNDKHDVAKDKYRRAIERGETNILAVRRLFEMLSSSRDEREVKEAYALIERLQNAPKPGRDFQRLAASVSLRAGSIEGAVRHAEQAVSDKSSKYEDQLWLGHFYWRSKRPDKPPEARFRRATDLAPEVMETWLTLLQYLVATGKKDDALKVFAQGREKVDPKDRTLFNALGNVQLGERDKAIEAFKRAREERPGEFRVLMAEAEYCLQSGRLSDARDGYERALALPSISKDEKAFAEQRKLLAYAGDPKANVAQKALQQLPPTAGPNETPAQKRARAVILGLQKNIEHIRTAIRLLEDNLQGSNTGERFLLAQLYNSVGNRTGVPLIMEELLQSEINLNPLHLRFYTRWLIKEGELAKASQRISQLVKIEPDSLGTAELKARLAAAKKDLRGAWDALRPKVGSPDAPTNVLAGICEDIGLVDEAEQLWKQFATEKQQTLPQAALAVATFHGRRGRTMQGLDICEQMLVKLPLPFVADAATNVLYNAPDPSTSQMKEQIAKVAGWLNSAIPNAAGPERNALLQHLAAIQNLQGDYEDAAKCYEEILKTNHEDPLALNNLAYLISATRKQSAEALEMINRAKRVMGDYPVLLDTEALILLNAGRPKEALPIMDAVVERAPSATAYFHRAQIKEAIKAGDIDARLDWERADELKLKEGDLHPLERPAYWKMKDNWK